VVPASEDGRAFRRVIHETIRRVTDDIEHDFHFNTAISAVMELVNALSVFDGHPGGRVPPAERPPLLREAVETILRLLGPFCPHITEELWSQLGHRESVFTQRWPTPDPAVEHVLAQAVVHAFSTNGRLRVVKPEEADALLEGEVVGYQIQPLALDPRANIQQYRLLVTMNLKMRDVRRNTLLFEQARFQEKSDFRVVGAVSQTIAREETALQAAAVDIARAIVSLAIDRF